jgi:aspartate/methionine/tyrosine aminotransferase
MANAIFSSLPTTIFEEMSGLARSLGAINLGQGFPDDPGPEPLRAKAADLVLNGYNQYPPMTGLPELRQAVAAHYARTQGLDFDWATEVTITSGATEALAVSFLGLLNEGDEVIVFQPYYDSYLPVIRRAGGVPTLISLQPPHWRFTRPTRISPCWPSSA